MRCLSAEEIIERAKEKIIPLVSQKETVNNIAALLSLHLKKLNAMENGVEADFLPTFSELIIAPTGSGKTYLISKLAEAAHLPFYIIDCSMLTMSGYKGLNLSEAFRNLKQNCPNPKVFRQAVILFDEFDKCSFRNGENGNVQPNFLKLLDGENISCGDEIIETEPMLFLFAGAFQGLDKLTEQRCQKKSIGFAVESAEEKVHTVTMEDVQAYGFSRELLGRIGSIHTIPTLTAEDCKQLMSGGKTSVTEKYGALFSMMGVKFSLDETACEKISRLAMERKMGARAVEAVVKEKILQAAGEIDKDASISEVILTVEDGEFAFQYVRNGREFSSLDEVAATDLEMALHTYLSTDRGINRLCEKWCKLAIEEDEELGYCFLQATLRFLTLETNREDWTVHSVELFAKQTKRQGIEGEKTTFDMMIGEIAPLAENSTHHNVLLHYYYLYKDMEDARSAAVLLRMARKIKKESKIK
ncbi:MAG: AAA family ATPase [Ruminococcaceae bacterium]|nr:AAA family ATPase [Oscillospiraceae bacterium]